jgi:hypothetical protein
MLHSLCFVSMQRLRSFIPGWLPGLLFIGLAIACCSCMQYLRQHVAPLGPGGAGDYLTWLQAGTINKQLLSVTGYEGALHYHTIRGNTDAAIVMRSSLKALMANTGLCILFELKIKVEERHIYQALCQLVLANVLSSSQRPVVVLTNLVDHWQLFWLAGRTVYSAVMSRHSAVAVINMCLQQAAARVPLSKVTLPAVPPQLELLLQRPEPQLPTLVGPATSQLAELEGCLPESELQGLRLAALLEQVTLLPGFSCMSMESPSPAGMYT